jgi:hypothetical protein
MPKLLELFCGTKSVGNVFEKNGYEVTSLDYNAKFNATHTEDILTWDYKQYQSNYFDVIWASPDCTTWSLASGGKYRLKTEIYGRNNQHQDKATLGNNMILRLIEILKYFNCKVWFIENPKALLRHFPPFKDFIEETNGNRTTVYYGNYDNWGFPKPTDIWSNIPLWNNETLPEFDESYYVKRLRPFDGRIKRCYKDFQVNAEKRSKIPPSLIDRLRLLIV